VDFYLKGFSTFSRSPLKRPSFPDNYLHKAPSAAIVPKIRTSNARWAQFGGGWSHRQFVLSACSEIRRPQRIRTQQVFLSAENGAWMLIGDSGARTWRPAPCACVYFIQSHKSRARPEIFIARGHSQQRRLNWEWLIRLQIAIAAPINLANNALAHVCVCAAAIIFS
jgi:hypothetical protein